jgi:putative ABC transport system permease protein
VSVQRDIDTELRFHLESRVDELMQQGMSRAAARAQALAEFGNVDQVRDGLREIDHRVARRRSRLETWRAWMQDVRYAARGLMRTPAVSLTIVLTLALGVGVNAAMFALLDVIYFRPPAAVVHPATVHRLWVVRPSLRGLDGYWPGFDYKGYVGLSRALAPDATLATYMTDGTRRLGRGENAPLVHVAGASSSYFSVLGLTPLRGRFYSEEEAGPGGTSAVVVVSENLWRRSFNADPDIVGRAIDLGPDKFTVIGVTPAGFRGVDLEATDLWFSPYSFLRTAERSTKEWWHDSNANGFQVLVRFTDSVNERVLAQRATQQLRAVGGDWRRDSLSVAQFGAINSARGPGKSSSELQVAMRLAAVAMIVLLIACANVVNLLLARAVNRRREIAVRLALGAGRSRLIRLLVTESTMLGAVAAMAAVLGAVWASATFRALLMPDVEWAQPSLHWRVLVFALLVATIAGLVAGLVPAWQSSSPQLADSLRSGTRAGSHRSTLRSALVVTQAALSLVLLVGAVLFIRSLRNVMARDVGYTVDRVLFAQARYDTRDSIRDARYGPRLESVRSRIAGINGVEDVAFTSAKPNTSISFTGPYFPDADTVARKKPLGTFTAVTREFFATTGNHFVAGGTFPESPSTAPIVINRAFATALWPNENPVGRCIRFEKSDAPCATIVGVVNTAYVDGDLERDTPHLYISIDKPAVDTWGVAQIVVRVDPNKRAFVETAIRNALGETFPGAYRSFSTMAEIMAPEYRPWELGAKLFTLFGVLALIVAAVGVFSTVSYAVTQRTHEFGVRMALGARGADVVRHVLGGELKTITVGILAGVALSIAGGRFIASLLYDVRPSDPTSIAVVALTLVATALVAAAFPAWRASRADPVSALRAE